MEEKELFAKNCDKHEQKVKELLEAYDLAGIGYQVQTAEENDIYNEVLAENEFFAPNDVPRLGIKKGDRITSHEHDFILADDDFQRLMDLAQPKFVKAKITDENGYIITNWLTILAGARRELYDYIVDNIIPDSMKQVFRDARWKVSNQEKLIDITRKRFCALI